jgi:hypothetical protein
LEQHRSSILKANELGHLTRLRKKCPTRASQSTAG